MKFKKVNKKNYSKELATRIEWIAKKFIEVTNLENLQAEDASSVDENVLFEKQQELANLKMDMAIDFELTEIEVDTYILHKVSEMQKSLKTKL